MARDAADGVGGALRGLLMKRPLLSRRDVIFVIIVAAGISTLLSVLTEKPSGRMLAFDAVLNAMEGLMIALLSSPLCSASSSAAEGQVNEANARLWRPWLRINRIMRVML